MNVLDQKEKIYSWFLGHKEEMVEDVCSMIRIPSVQGPALAGRPFGEECFRAVEKSMEIAGRFGLETSVFRNMVGQASLKKGRADFGIWTHSDVVPADGVWTDPPFEPAVRDGRIYGRGATDNKGQLVTMLYVLRCLKELGVGLKHNAAVFTGSNEETGMDDVRSWVAENEEPFFNLSPDSDFTVGYAEKASFRFHMEAPVVQKGLIDLIGGSALNVVPRKASAVLRLGQIDRNALAKLGDVAYTVDGDTVTLTVSGRGGHSSTVPGAENLYAKLLHAMDKAGVFPDGLAPQLRFLADACQDESGGRLGVKCSDPVVGSLHFAGTVLRFADGVVCLGGDIRHPAAVDPEQLLAKIGRAGKETGFTVRMDGMNPSKYSDPNEPGAAACAELYNTLAPEFGRREGKPYTMSGGTYARYFTRGYAFGLEAGGNFHNADEYVNVDRLLFGGMLYALCLMKLDEIYL